MTEPLRVVVVANKTWECEPLVAALLAKDARPAALLTDNVVFRRGYDPTEPTPPKPELPKEADGLPMRGNPPVRPRLLIDAPSAALSVEVWCIEDWMRTKRRRKGQQGADEIVEASSSSSHEKLTFSLARIREHAFAPSAAASSLRSAPPASRSATR